MRRWCLLVFPLLECVSFAAALAWSSSSILIATLLWLLATVAFSYTLHVTAHEWVHHSPTGFPRSDAVVRAITSVFIGAPFHGYVLHHLNHHEHENSISDWSSTWRQTSRGVESTPLWRYAFGWPFAFLRAQAALRKRARAGAYPPRLLTALRREQWLLGALLLAVAIYRWQWAIAYLALTYLGWVLIAIHNFGQHPPLAGVRTTSYRSAVYNWLTLNNGLHAEHHAQGATPSLQLMPASDVQIVTAPHPIAALLSGGAVSLPGGSTT